MRYHVTHSIQFKDGTWTAPYRLPRTYATARGALAAGERHALSTDRYYAHGTIALHALTVLDETGRFVTNEAV